MRRLLLVVGLGSSFVLNAQNWSDWKPDTVFHGIEVRERCGGMNEFASRYVWDVQLRNAYQKDIDLAWAAEPDLLRGDQAQAARALAVKPGEVVEAHHMVPKDCSAGLVVKVNEVAAAGALASAPAKTRSFQPKVEGRWTSKDPEGMQKQLVVKVAGSTVTGIFSSPNFSFQISGPLPEGLLGGVSVGVEKK